MSTAAARAARARARRQNIAETEEATVQQPPPPPPQPFDLDKVAKKFKNLGGVPFKGTETVTQAQAWLRNREKIFGGLELEDQRKRLVASWLLQEEAQNWWDIVMVRGIADNMTWTRFKELFNDKYIPRKEVERLHDEFANLKQGDKTISKYVRRFEDLSCYAPELIQDDFQKNKRFINWLARKYIDRTTENYWQGD